jgi:hypothetical protein
MNQLPLLKRDKPTNRQKRATHDETNLELARIQLADPRIQGIQREVAEWLAACARMPTEMK